MTTDNRWQFNLPVNDEPEPQGYLTNSELGDIMAMFPDVDFGHDNDEQLIIYTGRFSPPANKEQDNE